MLHTVKEGEEEEEEEEEEGKVEREVKINDQSWSHPRLSLPQS